MKRAGLAALALIFALAPGHAQNLSAEDLARRTVERRAVEAVIWAMPAVNLDLMLQAMIGSAKGKPNQIVYWSRLPDWKNQTLTPNPDVIYLMPFFNTKDAGPMVLEIPPADDGVINGTIMDAWQVPLEDVGPAGVDIRGMSRSGRGSQSQGLQKNADGSVDIYFGPKAPAGKESNWVPTNPSGQFEVLFRFYGPEKPLFDKTWKLPDIEKVN